MSDEELSIGPYLCTGIEFSSPKQVVVIFRNSSKESGGTALFRMSSEQSEKFKQGSMYKLFAREDTETEAPKRFLRKRP